MELIKFCRPRKSARRCLTATNHGTLGLGDESRHDGRPAEPLGVLRSAAVEHIRPSEDAKAGIFDPGSELDSVRVPVRSPSETLLWFRPPDGLRTSGSDDRPSDPKLRTGVGTP